MPLLSCARRSSDVVRARRVVACWRWHRTVAVAADGHSCDSPGDVDNLRQEGVAAETGADLVRPQIRVLVTGRVDFCCPFCKRF